MITIGICDDDPVFSDRLYQIINHIMFPLGDWESRLFHSGKEIIHAIEAGTFDCQLLFMDIMLDNGTGIQTAQYICSHCLNTDLIFVTASKDHVFECYHYHAFAYLLKPITECDIAMELQRYLREYHYSPKYLTISFQGITHQIPIHSILYIESNLRKLTIHTQKATYYCYQKLNDIAETLKHDGFVRCHQSYLIAFDKVTGHTLTQLYIQNTAIPISNRYQTALKKLFADESPTHHSETAASLSIMRKEYGALICTRGAYLGSIIRIKPEQKILICK